MVSGKRKGNGKRRRSRERKARTNNRPLTTSSQEAEELLHRRLSGHMETIARYLAEAAGNWSLVADRADAEILALIEQAQESLAPWHPLDALAWLRMSHLPLNAETYQESTFEGSLAVVELAGLLLLARDPIDAHVGPAPSLVSLSHGEDDLADPGLVAEMCRGVTATLKAVLDVAPVREIARAMATGETQARAEYLAIRMRSREVGLRNIEYAHLHRRFLIEQFSRPGISELVVHNCGFDMTDALAVVDALEVQLQEALSASVHHARMEIRAFRESDDPQIVHLRDRRGTDPRRGARLRGDRGHRSPGQAIGTNR